MSLQIAIANRQKNLPLNPARIKTAARRILQHEGVRQAALSLVFVTDSEITRLNKDFLGRDHPTDVLAFDLSAETRPGTLEGEVIISTVTARRQAREFAASVEEEVLLYIVHGILHLLGYDDHRPADVKKMREKEKEIIGVLAHKGISVLAS